MVSSRIEKSQYLIREEEAVGAGIRAVIYENEETGVRGVRFLNMGETKEDLLSAISDNRTESTACVTVQIEPDPELLTRIDRFLRKHSLSDEALRNGVSEYLCRPGNRKHLAEMIRTSVGCKNTVSQLEQNTF